MLVSSDNLLGSVTYLNWNSSNEHATRKMSKTHVIPASQYLLSKNKGVISRGAHVSGHDIPNISKNRKQRSKVILIQKLQGDSSYVFKAVLEKVFK